MEIRIERDVRCPDREATRHLASFIAEHSAGNGAIGITLLLPVNVFGAPRALPERRVLAKLEPLDSTGNPYTFSVTLSPKTTGIFPTFAGALAMKKSVTDDCVNLMLNGMCAPLEIAVAGSDVALGCRVARASARDLLDTIANYVGYASARNDAARAGVNVRARAPQTVAQTQVAS